DLPISRDYFLSIFEQGNSQPKVVHSSRSFEIVQSMVASGYGVTISAIAPQRDSAVNGYPLTTVPLTADVPNLCLGLAELDRGADTPASRAFQTYCAKYFKEIGPNLRARDGT
ncbi:MAG: hypothetical protein IT551_11940, partial [Novosphingobium sp.]|nr:hypothetical protein [Novosphingobium sp.]